MIMDIRWPAETFLMRKIEALAGCGYRITVLTPDSRKGGPRLPNVKAVRVPGGLRAAGSALLLFLRAAVRDIRQARRGLREWVGGGTRGLRLAARRWAVAAFRPDVLHFEWTLAAVPCLPLVTDARMPVVVSCRGTHVMIAPHNPRRQREAEALPEIFARAARVHCVSEAIAGEAVALGMCPEKAAVIRPAVDPARFVPAAADSPCERVRILMAGTLIWCKAYEFALTAFAEASNRGLDAELTIAGGGGKEEISRLLYTIHDLDLEGRVHWKGGQSSEKVLEMLRESDVFLHSSVSEGISNAVLEAMACGLPVVVTDAGGMREAVRDGVDGFVVPVRDVDAMAEALVKLACDPELRRRMGTAARQRVLEEFTLERQTRQWREWYEGLVRETAARRNPES
jgi:glycosyltransferase involved in cell wall biosynthesis